MKYLNKILSILLFIIILVCLGSSVFRYKVSSVFAEIERTYPNFPNPAEPPDHCPGGCQFCDSCCSSGCWIDAGPDGIDSDPSIPDCGNFCQMLGYTAFCNPGLTCSSANTCLPDSCAANPNTCACPPLIVLTLPPAPVCSAITVANWVKPTSLPTATPTPICGGGRVGEPTCAPTQPPASPTLAPTPIPTVFKARWSYQLEGVGSGGQAPSTACWSSSCTGGAGDEGDELGSVYNPGVLGAVGGASYPSCGRTDCCNASKAFDSSTSTFWATQPGTSTWNLYYNYGQTIPANTSVTINYYAPYYPNSFTISTSMDGVNWDIAVSPTPTPILANPRPGDPTPTPSPPTPTPNPVQTYTIIPAHRYLKFTFTGGGPYIREITTSRSGSTLTPIPTIDTRGRFSPVGANPINWTVPYPILPTPTLDPVARLPQQRTPICTVTFFATDALGRNTNTCSVTGGWVDAGPPPGTPTPSPSPIPMGTIKGHVYIIKDTDLKLSAGEKCYYSATRPVTITAYYTQAYLPLGKNSGDVAGTTTYNGSSLSPDNCPVSPYTLSVPKGLTYNVTFTKSDITNTGYNLEAYDTIVPPATSPSGYTAPGNATVQMSVP